MANIIEKVNVGGTTYNIASTAYAVCSNAANEAKVINIDGFSLVTGVTIHVKFANANTVSSPTLTISGGDTEANNPIPIVGIGAWNAGAVLTLTYDGTNWVRDYDVIIANNVTGSGTSGYLTKFNGTNSITNGPQLGSDTTKFLNNKGEWAVPNYTTNTDEKVKQTGITTSGNYPILFKNSANTTDETTGVNYGKTTNKLVTINPSTGAIAAPGGLTGNASTATKFSSTRTISLSGDVSGSATSNGESGWSITTTIGEGAVTNAMLAGSIANAKLTNSKVTIAGQDVSLGGSIDASTLRTKLGLTQALRFVGSTTTTMSDGYTGTPAGISIYTGTGAVAPAVGDVVLDSSSNAEYACVSVSGTTYTWEILGAEGSWALSNDVIHISGEAGDILYWSAKDTPARLAKASDGQVLKLADGLPTWGTDNNNYVTQNILATTVTDTYPLLVSAYKTSQNTTSATTVNRVAAIYVQPSTGTLTATEFVGGGSGLTGVTASSVAWGNVTGKKFAALYVNATSGGAASNATATDPYIHLYDNEALKSTIQIKGAGGASVASNDSKVITITSTKYKSSGSASALTSLKLKYNDGTAHDDAVSNTTNTPTALGTVTNAVLYIKSMYYGTTSVSTGVSVDNT